MQKLLEYLIGKSLNVKEYDDGIRVGSPIEKMDFKALKGTMNQSKKSGCAGILLALIIVSGALVLL